MIITFKTAVSRYLQFNDLNILYFIYQLNYGYRYNVR